MWRMKNIRRTSGAPARRGLSSPAWALFLGLLAGGLGCATDHPPAGAAERPASASPNVDAAQALVSGEAKLRAGNLDGAFDDYNRAIALRPKHAPAYAGRAFVRYQQGN